MDLIDLNYKIEGIIPNCNSIRKVYYEINRRGNNILENNYIKKNYINLSIYLLNENNLDDALIVLELSYKLLNEKFKLLNKNNLNEDEIINFNRKVNKAKNIIFKIRNIIESFK